MRNKTLRNITWITLIAVWSFLAGAYFNLGWVKDTSLPYLIGFIMGGIALWLVFFGIGILVYRVAKQNGNEDPSKLSLYVVSFFTVCFLLIAWVKYDEVRQNKFFGELESVFVVHYKDKAVTNGIHIEKLDRELRDLYSSIRRDLRKHPQLEELMQIKTADGLFEENAIIKELCLRDIELHQELGYPYPSGMQELFE